MRRLGTFHRDRSGLVGADVALIALLVFASRYVAMRHGAEIGTMLAPLLAA